MNEEGYAKIFNEMTELWKDVSTEVLTRMIDDLKLNLEVSKVRLQAIEKIVEERKS